MRSYSIDTLTQHKETVAEPKKPAELSEKLSEIERVMEKLYNQGRVRGLAAGIHYEGIDVLKTVFGMADADMDEPVSPDTVFRVGSISKTMTAIGVMQLWEQGKFQLDDPVNDHLKSFKIETKAKSSPPITIKHLLTHTSGLGLTRNLTDTFSSHLNLGRKHDVRPPTLAEYYNGKLIAPRRAGEDWFYSNHGYAALGQLVEDVSGQPFADYMVQHVFEPLGMHCTDYRRTKRIRDKLAIGYKVKRGRFKPVEDLEIIPAGAGSVYSNLDDMMRYLEALIGYGENKYGRVLRAETVKLMYSPQFFKHPSLVSMGLGFILDPVGPHRAVMHNGGWPGFSSSMWFVPELRYGIIMFSNVLNDYLDTLCRQSIYTIQGSSPEQQTAVPSQEDRATWKELFGAYVTPKKAPLILKLQFLRRVQVSELNGKLRVIGLSVRGEDILHPLAEKWTFETAGSKTPQRIAFLKRGDGSIQLVTRGFYTLIKLTKRDHAILLLKRAALFAGLLGATWMVTSALL
jgi:CubicO group peptidase (beta-lactamase class C family)